MGSRAAHRPSPNDFLSLVVQPSRGLLGDLAYNALMQARRPQQRRGAVVNQPSPSGSARTHRPTLGERVGSLIYRGGQAVGHPYPDRLRSDAANMPVIGDLLTFLSGSTDLARGNTASGLGQITLAGLGVIPGAGDAAVAGIRQGGRRVRDAAQVARANYRMPVSEYTPTLYRETSPDQAQYFMPHSNSSSDLSGEMYFANTPELALGQGTNRGVLLEFDASDLQGRVSTAKPMWGHMWDQGQGEYVLRLNRQSQYQRALRGVTIRPEAVTSPALRERLARTIGWHEQQGWTRTANPDGSVTLRRPE